MMLARVFALRSPGCTLSLCLAVGIAWSACANVTEDPPAAIDASVSADAPMEPEPGCGNEIVEPGEACDGANLNDEDCSTRGFQSGELSCDACAFDTSGCYACGDGVRSGAEECEGLELGGQTCQGLGYLGGSLACDAATCTFDITGCDTREILQNHDGNCLNTLGCSNAPGSFGNPQSMLECFRDVVIPPPFWLTQVSYGIGSSTPAPGSLNLEVYTWTGEGPPGARLTTVPLEGKDLSVGDHTLLLTEPVELDSSNFCVALNGTDSLDGFEVTYSSTAEPAGTSFLQAPECGITVASDINSILTGPGTWCIGAQIDKLLP